MAEEQPLIVTLLLDNGSFEFFEALRQHYFPHERNFLQAHLTLFHHLPASEQKIKDDLEKHAKQTTVFSLKVTAVVSIGKGVAYKIESPQLVSLHKRMQQDWKEWLTSQDKQKLWPHVTVQNKVSPQAAKETLETLKRDFQPFTAQALGLSLWRYEDGPWSFEKVFLFSPKMA